MCFKHASPHKERGRQEELQKGTSNKATTSEHVSHKFLVGSVTEQIHQWALPFTMRPVFTQANSLRPFGRFWALQLHADLEVRNTLRLQPQTISWFQEVLRIRLLESAQASDVKSHVVALRWGAEFPDSFPFSLPNYIEAGIVRTLTHRHHHYLLLCNLSSLPRHNTSWVMLFRKHLA